MISIVDDDAPLREAIVCLMRSLGYDARSFGSAEEFLDSPHADTTSCLIADVQMPGMSGFELQESLIAKGCKIPIIFISAFPGERLKAKALAPDPVSTRKPWSNVWRRRCARQTAALAAETPTPQKSAGKAHLRANHRKP